MYAIRSYYEGNDLINFHAREFTRTIDGLSGDDFFNEGVSLGEGLGRLFIETGKPFSEELSNNFPEHRPDHIRITSYNVCYTKLLRPLADSIFQHEGIIEFPTLPIASKFSVHGKAEITPQVLFV